MKIKKTLNALKQSAKFPGKIQNRHLDRSILLQETGSDGVIKSTIYMISLILVGFIIWASFLQIAEVASTTGEITHQGDVVQVQHLAGGRVKKVYVKNGSVVKKGQTLMTLDPIITGLELNSIRDKLSLMIAKKIRLMALLNGKEPDFSKIEDKNIKIAQKLLYTNTLESYGLEKLIIGKQINQVRIEAELLKKERDKLNRNMLFIKEELDIRRKLRSKGLNSRITLLTLEKEYNDAKYSLNQFPEKQRKYEQKEKELRNSVRNITAIYMKNSSKELEQVSSEIATTEKQISIYDNNIESLRIKAPVEGIVHNIRMKGAGQIAKSGEVLMTIIPTEKALVAKVHISAKDIGHVRRGQTVIMRVTTYDSRRYGVLKGTVYKISPSVLIPEDRTEPYYEGIILLEKNYIGKNEEKLKVFSGMTLTADINTGSKYFIEYLLKPIYVSTQTSFTER
jgi:HlyD family secretion protein/adhesin transport system membrane fusion protein